MALFALISNPYKDEHYAMLRRVADILQSMGAQIMIDARNRNSDLEEAGFTFAESLSGSDMIISMGGDGTFLNAVHSTSRYDIPIIGINLGSVGFLTEINLGELRSSMEHLMRGEYDIEERMMLEVRCRTEAGADFFHGFALNEVLLTRGISQRIIPVHLGLDSSPIELIRCDGIIVGTPTGSTGYAMAAGGPIVSPELNVIQITPVCPYSLHNRTYLLHTDTEISLELGNYPYKATLSVDGRQTTAVSAGDVAVINKALKPLHMVRLKKQNFFQALPDKLRVRSESH